MENNNLQNAIDLFKKHGQSYWMSILKKEVAKIRERIIQLNQSIGIDEDRMSLMEWGPSDKSQTPNSLIVPQQIRLGNLLLRNINGATVFELPFFLPVNANGIMFNLGTDSEKVPDIFQNIILRLLLTMRMDLVKVSIVDLNYGNNFPIVASLKNPMLNSEIIYQQDKITNLINQLGAEISNANANFLAGNPNIDIYNASAGEMAQPYHFVFIDGFPNGFTPSAIDDLIRLISNGNATRVGIHLFINYSQRNPAPRDFDLHRFESCCSWISKDSAGTYSFMNWPLNISPKTDLELDTEVTDRSPEYVNYLNSIKPRSVTYSLDAWIEKLKATDQVWKGSTVDGIRVPIGYSTPTKTFDFYIANDNDSSCKDFFALIAGLPGYGKTVMLHNIIVNAAMKYSPDELCFYLADFAEGASFNIYRNLPHVKSLMLSNNKEYALRMIDDIELEAKKRSNLYKQGQKQFGKQINTLSNYREVTGQKIPRIILIMDEFHYLFLSTDATTIRAKEKMCNGIRQWRKFGISVILCTQSISGVNFGSTDTYITYRFALNLLEMDSKTVIRNTAAVSLKRKGQAIMNNSSDGNLNANVEFQCAYSPYYLDYVKYLSELYSQKFQKPHIPFICEDETDVDIFDNQEFAHILANKKVERDNNKCYVFVGKPDLLRPMHTRILYRRQQNSNTIIIGDDYRTLIFNLMTQLIQLWYKSPLKSKFYMLDCFNVGDMFQGALNDMCNLSNNFVTGLNRDASSFINEIYDELEKRKEKQKNGEMTEERIVLVIMNTHNCDDLKRQSGKYGLESSESNKKLVAILSDGSPLGVHCIIHTQSYEILFKRNQIFDSDKYYSLFENQVFLKGADIGNMYLGGLKFNAPDVIGRMVVVNAKTDGEPYEQCNAYSCISARENNATTLFMDKYFQRFQNT